MSAVKHSVIVAAYGLAAVALGLLLPGRFPELGAEFGVTIAVAGFVLCALLHQVMARSEREEMLVAQLDALYDAYDKIAEDVDLLREEARTIRNGLAEMTDDVEQRAEEHLQKVTAEVRVLQGLIEELSTRRVAEQDGRAAVTLRVVGGETQPKAAKPSKAPPRRVRADLDHAQTLDIVREGLKRDRVDLFLQPIVSLPQRKPRFYECFSRIRDADGAMVLPEQYIEVAKKEGFLRAIDNMLLFRCIQLVRKAQRHKHNLGFFCNMSVETLGDRSFLREFIAFMAQNRELASQLTFELAEEDILSRWDDVSEDLNRLARLGFYFSMDRVRGIDLAPELLARRHFKFVKLDAGTLLNSGAKGGMNIRALKQELDRNGIDLIVEKIEGEQQLVELLDHHIDFGQGFLFGEPRLSRES